MADLDGGWVLPSERSELTEQVGGNVMAELTELTELTVAAELTELVKSFTEMLQIGKEELVGISDRLMTEILERGNELFEFWIEKYPDLSVDNLQPIYQYYLADRKVKKQDYTPVSLAKTAAKLAMSKGGSSCYDICAGSGALSIQVWSLNRDCKFICEELDGRVIPFLIFNLAIRNINAVVIHGDVLSGEQFAAWRLQRNTGTFSSVTKCEMPIKIKADFCISNPPYNIKWDAPIPLASDIRFGEWGVPPASNANYAFVLTALRYAEVSVLILPNIVLSADGLEKDIRSELVKQNMISAVVTNPDNMFEDTSIGTCLLVLDKNKTTAKIQMVDMRQEFETVVRLQNGQYGGKSHEGRIYQKNVKIYSDKNIERLINAVMLMQSKKGFCKAVTGKEVEDNKYKIVPSVYIEIEETECSHRPYADILNDINRVRNRQNGLKLVINQTIANGIGLDTIAISKGCEPMGNEEILEKISGVKLIDSDYITFTKNKGEIVLKNNSKNEVPDMIMCFVQMWRMFIMECNSEENKYLAELRDALLPDLMSGKLEI